MDKCINEIREGNIEYIKCNVARGQYGRTLLHYAVYYGRVSIVKLLLRRGADPNAQDDIGQTPLHLAKRFDVAKLLLRYGADPNIKTKYEGRTPLHYAAIDDNLSVVGILLKYGTYIDAKDSYGKTPLYLAVLNAHTDVVSYLLWKGADPNVRDERGLETPLHVASHFGEAAIVKLLIKHGADPHARDIFRRTPLHFARWPDTAMLLLRRGADPNARDSRGRTPLHYAVEEKRIGVIKVLLRYGADPTIADREGKAPVDIAREVGIKMPI